MQSGFDINQLLQEAQTRWLKPPEVLSILQNHEKYHINQHAPQKPPSGALFLFNKRVLRFFRKDGHNWRKKRDGRNVGEAHERLKVGNAEALNCYYAHGEENPNFQRRSYWMLDQAYEHIVLVHYRDIMEGSPSSVFAAELSPGPSPVSSQSPSAHTIQNQDSCSLTNFHDSYQSHSSPGSTEVNSDAVMGKRIDYFNHSSGAEKLGFSSDIEVNQALRRLEVQLSLDDDSFKEYGPLDNQVGNEDEHRMLDDLFYSGYDGSCSISSGLSLQQDSAFELGNRGVRNVDSTSSLTKIDGTPESSTMLLGAGRWSQVDSTLTVAKEQRFTIHEMSPEWGFSGDYTKVIIVGSFLCDPADCVWHCMFGEIEIPLQFIQNGVFCCNAPPQPSGKVTLCITSGNRESCSEIREFEYRDKYSSSTHGNKQKGEITKSTEELLSLVRFVQMLLSNASLQQGENNGVAARKQNNDDYSWGQIIEALLVGGGTTTGTLDWLLQQLLKDKLQQWLSSRSLNSNRVDCSLSKKEQGIIHMVAGLGYEWALNSILACQVGINFRDINGWTALHWAARFGREKMVAALIASGASAVAVTDPSSQDPVGRMPAYIAAANGHKGLAAYLSEVALTTHLSSLKLEENELSKGFVDVEAESAINNIQKESFNSTEDQLSLKHSLGAVRNAAHAAARIQAAFRAHSFRKRQQTEAATAAAAASCVDEYGFTPNDIQGLSAASKMAFRNLYDHNKAALSIQKNYRSWKGRKDFLTLRQKVVKIQAHVRGYQVRKKHICWAVGILDKAVLRWRRKGAGLRGYKPESDSMNEEEKDEDIVKAFRKERVNAAIDEAVSTVLSMVDSPEARQQYNRMLGKYQEAKAELQGLTSQAATTLSQGMNDSDVLWFP